MGEFGTSLIAFGLLWALLRLGNELWGKNLLPAWATPIGGIVAWACVLSIAGPFIALARLFLVVMEKPNVAVAYQIGGIAILGSLLAKVLVDHTEILDYDRVQPFLFASLKFQRYGASRENIFAKLEQQEIKAIYKEQTGKDLTFEPQGKKQFREMSEAEARRELAEARKINPRSIHLKAEIDQLLQGKTTDITEAFKINVMKLARHRLYEECSDVAIDPETKTMRFKIRFPELTSGVELTRERMFRIYQDLYDALQSLNMEHWMAPYHEFIESYSITCHRVEMDGFDMSQEIPFMTMEIATSELRSREKTIFIASELAKIATITMTEGKNIL
ncbi:MAG: hypothetical protein WBD36_02265 [Bacteroidota bacterium]